MAAAIAPLRCELLQVLLLLLHPQALSSGECFPHWTGVCNLCQQQKISKEQHQLLHVLWLLLLLLPHCWLLPIARPALDALTVGAVSLNQESSIVISTTRTLSGSAPRASNHCVPP